MSKMVSGLLIAGAVMWAAAATMSYVGGSLSLGVLMTFASLMCLAAGVVWLVRYSRGSRRQADHSPASDAGSAERA